ncbi:hypothetical protein Ancab_010997 [Ancistrocladus abbreviatus]
MEQQSGEGGNWASANPSSAKSKHSTSLGSCKRLAQLTPRGAQAGLSKATSLVWVGRSLSLGGRKK